jgi:hypothetical protein
VLFANDVSALGKVYVLDVSHCQGISDVSALGNVDILDISCCREISDISAVSNVPVLIAAGIGSTGVGLPIIR